MLVGSRTRRTASSRVKGGCATGWRERAATEPTPGHGRCRYCGGGAFDAGALPPSACERLVSQATMVGGILGGYQDCPRIGTRSHSDYASTTLSPAIAGVFLRRRPPRLRSASSSSELADRECSACLTSKVIGLKLEGLFHLVEEQFARGYPFLRVLDGHAFSARRFACTSVSAALPLLSNKRRCLSRGSPQLPELGPALA